MFPVDWARSRLNERGLNWLVSHQFTDPREKGEEGRPPRHRLRGGEGVTRPARSALAQWTPLVRAIREAKVDHIPPRPAARPRAHVGGRSRALRDAAITSASSRRRRRHLAFRPADPACAPLLSTRTSCPPPSPLLPASPPTLPPYT
jgi:hypothetical protein